MIVLPAGTRVVVDLYDVFIAGLEDDRARGTVLRFDVGRRDGGGYLVRVDLPADVWTDLEPSLYSHLTYRGYGKEQAAWFSVKAVEPLSVLDCMAEAAAEG